MMHTAVAGVGMVPFTEPGRSAGYSQMGEAAARAALADAGLDYSAVEQAYVGYVYGDSTSGHMVPGALCSVFTDRPAATERFDQMRAQIQGVDPDAPPAAQLFGGAGQAYVDEFGIDPAIFAQISVKARRHTANNPFAVFRDPITVEQVLEALALTPSGTAEKFTRDGDNTYGGRGVTNPSGGLLSKGHPLGATGLSQCAELVWQLRSRAGDRQVDGVTLALQHNLGAAATGQTDPVYTDLDAAKRAGHRDLPVPPTFLFGVDLEGPEPLTFLADLGVDLRTVLHEAVSRSCRIARRR